MQPTSGILFREVKAYAKIYPKFIRLIEFNTPRRVAVAGYELSEHEKNRRASSKMSDETNPMSFVNSIRRTRTRIRDIVVSNDFDLFCTFTFAEDRYDVERCKRKMSRWLKHQSERKGKFAYLIVPEFHKDGKAIHFHALFKGYKGELVDTGHRTKRGQISYVIPSYTLGYSTAIKIDNIEAVGSYIRKYITKDMPVFKGRKRYWCSHGLVRPKKIANPIIFDDDYASFEETYANDEMIISEARKRVAILDPDQIYRDKSDGLSP